MQNLISIIRILLINFYIISHFLTKTFLKIKRNILLFEINFMIYQVFAHNLHET